MGKILYLSIFVLFALLFPIKMVYAVPAPPWETVIGCAGSDYLLTKADQHIPIRYSNEFLSVKEHQSLCVKSGTIGGIVEDTITTFSICPGGYTIPRNPSKPSEFIVRGGLDPLGVGYGCCPDSYPYLFADTGWQYCANVTSISNPSILNCVDNASEGLACLNECSAQSAVKCGSATGEQGSANNFYSVFDYGTGNNLDLYLTQATSKYVCNSPNCMTLYGASNNDSQGVLLDEYTIGYAKLGCVTDGSINLTDTCVRGTWYLTSAVDEWGGDIGIFLTCNDFVDPNEATACLACYKTCSTPNTCSYSSLGCIQTTQNGIIVRIFQIGLGVVGALAIARFIQAALLRQTADPSKIQESYDIITSLIIGLVVLLGSTVILRFIGVDILQMFPF